jgi:hypothetical protein
MGILVTQASFQLVADDDDDVAFLLFGLGVPMGLSRLFKGKAPIDDRPQLPGLDQILEE